VVYPKATDGVAVGYNHHAQPLALPLENTVIPGVNIQEAAGNSNAATKCPQNNLIVHMIHENLVTVEYLLEQQQL